MKKTLLICLLLCAALQGLAQSHGITYQAIILSRADNITEIPGVDVPGGNYLPDQSLSLRFTILDASGNIEYQETHSTATDRYGLVSVVIGDGSMTSASPDVFEEIDWNGSPKDLRVEVNIPAPQGQGEFMEFSVQKLVFAPYVYHRNITATGTMYIAGASTLDSSLVVNGTTDLNNGLDVNFGTPTNLSGTLNVGGAATLNSGLDVFGATNLHYTLEVDGATNLNSTLDVDGGTTLNSTLDVDGATTLNHSLDVDGATTLNNTLDVDGATTLNNTLDVDGASLLHSTLDVEGQTTIHSTLTGGGDQFGSYPLRVEGGQQGMAIRVAAPTPDASNNFITFFDSNNEAKGRIEGQTEAEVYSSEEFIMSQISFGIDAVAMTAGIICDAIGAWDPSNVCNMIVSGVELVAVTAAHVAESASMVNNAGVTYQSGGADYAEWLERENPEEQLTPGDVVGVKSGRICKRTDDAQHVLVISTAPIVLGNMPAQGREDKFERVAFLGQVPVKVAGMVRTGDYILPSGHHDGFAVAVHPADLPTYRFNQIIGIAWENGKDPLINVVNTAIGMNHQVIATRVSALEGEVASLRAEVADIKRLMTGEIPSPNPSGPLASPALPTQPVQDRSNATTSVGNERATIDLEDFLAEYGYILNERMEAYRAYYHENNIDYRRNADLARLIDTPQDAFRAMRSGDFMPSVWRVMQQRYGLR